MEHPPEEDVRVALASALDALLEADKHLLHADASERSLTHCLAVHLAKYFPACSVDCECNRDGFEIKKLQLEERHTADDALEATAVIPDLIVHVRGRRDCNLLVVEVKKASSPVSHDYDRCKLKAFKSQLDYRYAVHVVIGYGMDGSLVNNAEWA